MIKRSIVLFLAISLLGSCHSGDSQRTITVDNKYSISIPTFLTKVSNLNEDASLQYQHAWKEFYVIVIDESRSELQEALKNNGLTGLYSSDLKGYSALILDGFEENISFSQKSEPIDTLVNNMPARLLTIQGRVDGIDAFFSLAFVEGKKRYYQIMAWTLSNKKYQYKDKMSKIMYSLIEL